MKHTACWADQHIHSDNSPDGIHSVMLLCEKAIEKQIGCIAVTDHCEINEFYQDNGNIAVKQSFFDIQKARNVFKGQITLLNGIELGQATADLALAEHILGAFPYDVVLGSMHSVRNRRDFAFLDYENENPQALLSEYFDEVLALAEWGKFNVLTHLTYPLRFMEGEYGLKINLAEYKDRITAIFRLLVQKGIALEINTSGLRQPFGKIMPDLWCLRLYKELGGTMVTLGSDAHRGDDIGAGFAEGIEIAKEAGFRGYTLFRSRKPVFAEF